MEKRLFLAMILTALVLVVVPRFFSNPPASSRARGADTGQAASPSTGVDTVGRVSTPDSRNSAIGTAPAPTPLSIPAETSMVVTPTTRYRFTNAGAKLVGTELTQYRGLSREGGNVELSRDGEA